MPRIFISYRRQDSADFTGRIYDRLIAAVGDGNVFRDVYDIPAGSDFRAVLEREVSRCDTFLEIIGPHWVNASDPQGKPRLHDPNDFVRIEAESALKRAGARVIPVLVDNAAMPKPEDLPESLRELCYRNAVVVRTDPDFPHDMEMLIRQLKPSTRAAIIRKWWPIPVLVGILLIAALALRPQPNYLPNGLPTDKPRITLASIAASTATHAGTPAPTDTLIPGGYIFPPNKTSTAAYSFSLFKEASQDALIMTRVQSGEQITVAEQSADRTWTKIRLESGLEGWALSEDLVTALGLSKATPTSVATAIAVGRGFGARTDAWQLYFTAPGQTPDPQTQFGIDVRLADAISRAKDSVDLAVYEIDNKQIITALLDAARLGTRVRMVTDDHMTQNANGEIIANLRAAGITVVANAAQSHYMHDKFVILDGSLDRRAVWSGSWNPTEGGTYRNNENALVFTDTAIIRLYQSEFDKMFNGEFGRQKSVSASHQATVAGIPVEVYFAPQDYINIGGRLTELVSNTQRSITVMANSFNYDDLGNAMQDKVKRGVTVKGIFEKNLSRSPTSQFGKLFCARADVRWDNNPYNMHHDVIIIDDEIVITGSASFSSSSLETNDENVIIVHDPRLAAAYNQEFDRLWADATPPTDITCP